MKCHFFCFLISKILQIHFPNQERNSIETIENTFFERHLYLFQYKYIFLTNTSRTIKSIIRVNNITQYLFTYSIMNVLRVTIYNKI